MIKWIYGKGNELSESECENKLLSEKWHSFSGYCNLDKIMNIMVSLKMYIQSQSNLEYNIGEYEISYLFQKPDLLKSTRFKKYARSGIPIKYTRDTILKMFNVEISSLHENYKTRFISIFKNRDPQNLGNNVPYLSNKFTLEENLPIDFLNEKGLETIKELMWLLYSVVPNNEFCPLLLKIISLSLIFLTKEETFAFIKQIVISDYSLKNVSSIRFRFRFNYNENKKLIASFIESFKIISTNFSKEILKKLYKINFDIQILIEDMFFNFFIGYLNFSLLHRTFILFLNEGSKILFRVAYAILKTLKTDILNISKPENVINLIKTKAFEITDESLFFSLAFSYKLSKSNNNYEEIKIIDNFELKNTNFYIPTINGESNIMTDDDIFQLWNIFPDSFKNKDSKLIYSTDFHGFSLDKIYDISLDPENSCFNCFIIILTKKGQIFGVIMSIPLDKNRTGFYKPAYTGLFKLKPCRIRYDVVTHSDRMVYCGDDKLVIGLSKNVPALEIEKDLMIGFSYRSDIFDSPSLSASDCNGLDSDCIFEVSKLEVYILY